ncbi:MAG: hypothetical protein JNM56_29645 [Planctomycetia bacterium]|nr:hypothetical protein [Planctomycetia bacterium]
MLRRILPTYLLFLGVVSLAVAGTIEKKYPDGTLRVKYAIDDNGDKEGVYEEFYPNGKLKVKATYKADVQEGAFKSYHENGKLHVTATYKAGKLEGLYVEENEQGQKVLAGAYKDGKLNGTLTRFEKGKPVLTQIYKDDEPAYSRTLDDIKKKLGEILGAGSAGDDAAALRRLKAYRYLAEVPYENIELDGEMTKGAIAAAAICEKLGKLDHNPPNPGLPEAEYKLAHNACKSTNLAMGITDLARCVDLWMIDSDPGNIQMLGHRRWAIHPVMQKTGFGKSGRYTAMWAFDRSQKSVPDFDYVAYPPRGLAPVEFFGGAWAWNVSLNPKKFAAPKDGTKVSLTPMDAQLNKAGEPLKLNFNKISNIGAGVPYCIIFRPEPSAVAPGKRYLVEIEGLQKADGKTAASISYLTEFVSLK